MSGKAKTKQQEAQRWLDDLDSFEAPPAPPAGSGANAPAAGEEEVYAFIDEITQKSSAPPRPSFTHVDRPPSRAGTPTLRKTTGERVKVGAAPVPLLPTTSNSGSIGGGTSPARTASPISRAGSTSGSAPASAKQDAPPPSNNSGGWGWGSVWNSASAAIQQAKSVVDEQVKNLPKNEQARKWGEGVMEYAKAAQLDKISEFITSLT